MVLSVRMYEAANDYGPLEQFDVDPATVTVMDIMRRVRKSTALHNRHVRVGMRLHTYADHVPGDLINDTEKDPLVLSATLDELQQSGCVEYEEGRHGLHLKVLVDGCRTAEEVAEFTLEHSWRMEYEHAAQARDLAAQARELAVLMREVEELKEERDVAVRLARAALGSDVFESKNKQNSADSNKKPSRSSFMQLVSDVTMSAADRGDLCGLRVLHDRLLREASDQNCVGHTCNEEAVTYLPVVDEEGMTVVHRAARCGHAHIVRMLGREYHAEVNSKDICGKTPLHLAAERGHVDTLRILVEDCGSNVNMAGNYGRTPLHLAAENGHVHLVRMLVEDCGADVNSMDKNGRTPLHLASEKGYVEIVRIFAKELGVDVNSKAVYGKTPLHLASEKGHVEIVRMLGRDYHAEVNSKDVYGKTPLHLASERGHLDIVRILVEDCGSNVNMAGNYGRTPLHLAAEKGHVDIVRMLVEDCGADVNSKDFRGEKPVHLASEKGHVQIVRIFAK